MSTRRDSEPIGYQTLLFGTTEDFMVRKPLPWVARVGVLAALAFGCGQKGLDIPQAALDIPAAVSEDHDHKPSAHGGLIVPIGRNNYHAEAVFEKDGVLKLYTLGADEAK